MAEKPRLWGIDLIASVYVLALVLMVVLIEFGSGFTAVFGFFVGLPCLFISCGLYCRYNPARIL